MASTALWPSSGIEPCAVRPSVNGVEPHDALVGHARLVRRRLGDEHGAHPAERAVLAREAERALAAGLLARAQHDL